MTQHESAIRDFLVEKARAVLAEPPKLIDFTKDLKADALLNDLSRYPHAFVIACICDRQVKAELAWFVPYRLSHRLGDRFEFRDLAALSAREVGRLFNVPEPIHRLRLTMPALIHAAIERVARDYNGDASAIRSERPSSATVIYRFLEFRGRPQDRYDGSEHPRS